MRVLIHKGDRLLCLFDGAAVVLRAAIALGSHPAGAKACQGDGKTPEGTYTVCLIKPAGIYGRSLGLNYPNAADARRALAEGRIDADTCRVIVQAVQEGRRPPWGTPLGGEIYIHEGGAHRDWTQGCIALNPADMDILFAHRAAIAQVDILP